MPRTVSGRRAGGSAERPRPKRKAAPPAKPSNPTTGAAKGASQPSAGQRARAMDERKEQRARLRDKQGY